MAVLIQMGPDGPLRLIRETQRSHPGRVRVSKPGEHPADVAELAVRLASQHLGSDRVPGLIRETQRSHPGRMRVSKPGEHPADVAQLAVGLASQHPG